MRNSEHIELIHGVGPSRADELRGHDLKTIGDIASAEPSVLAEVTGIDHEMALELRRSAHRFIARDEGLATDDGLMMDFGNPHEVTLGAEVIESLRVNLPGDSPYPLPGAGPLAAFRIEPRSPAVGEATRVDATPSLGNITEYAWDFDFDGAFTPAVESTDNIASHTYETSGDREIALRVTDDDGSVDLVSKPISVGSPADGPAVRFVLEDGFEAENNLLRRLSGAENQSFTAETNLDTGTTVDIRLSDYPAGMPFDSTVERVDDGMLRGSFDLQEVEPGTYFFEARRNGSVLGRVAVGVFPPPIIE